MQPPFANANKQSPERATDCRRGMKCHPFGVPFNHNHFVQGFTPLPLFCRPRRGLFYQALHLYGHTQKTESTKVETFVDLIARMWQLLWISILNQNSPPPPCLDRNNRTSRHNNTSTSTLLVVCKVHSCPIKGYISHSLLLSVRTHREADTVHILMLLEEHTQRF